MNPHYNLPVQLIDSHTAGEPTRLVISGGPDLGDGNLTDRLACLRKNHDWLRTSICLEPRASEAAVGALLCAPDDPNNTAAVIFFNNSGYLGMCGHGMIGLIATLEFMGRISQGKHRVETPVGLIDVTLHGNGKVTILNVASRRIRKDVAVEVDGFGTVVGDIAWGGNWFFLIKNPGIDLQKDNLYQLIGFCKAVRRSLAEAGISADGGAEIDHIEIFGEPHSGGHSRNFVFCPGEEYDRSPCGTGTSAKLACLYEDGLIKEGDVWLQEGILGGIFECRISIINGELIPEITSEAFVTQKSDLIFSEGDLYRYGIKSQ